VAPSSVWYRSPARSPADSSSIACGWSPVGTYELDVLSGGTEGQGNRRARPDDNASLCRVRGDHGDLRRRPRRRGGDRAPARPRPARARLARPRRARPRHVQGGADDQPRRGDQLPARAVRRRAGTRRRRGPGRDRRHAAGDRRARHVLPLRRHLGRRGARRDAGPRAALRPVAHVDARRRGRERLAAGRLRRAHEQREQLAIVAALRRLAPAFLLALVLAAPARTATTHGPQLLNLRIDDGPSPFAGDNRYLATVSPNGDGFRDTARIHFTLAEPATVTMDVTRTIKKPVSVVYTLTESFPAGKHTMTWTPSTQLNPRTYLIRMTSVDAQGHKAVYGAPNAHTGRYPQGVVVRVQGIDAGFTRPSYAPDQLATIHIATDEPTLTYQVFHAGPEKYVVYADNQFGGIAVGAPGTLDWSKWRNQQHSITFRIPEVPSGLYYVQFSGADGRIGYAPFVVRPSTLGATSRVLVVLPTNTWQAYNYQDVDGNGYGDTWYAGPPNRVVDLGRTFIARGVPPHYYRYDLPFLHWLYWGGHAAEFIGDSDFDTIANGDQLAKAYDLVIFEGHEEYVTPHEYDVVQRYRDLGGNLMFLSANNFFWQIREL